jgi:Lar family restriction alleviation protein
MNEELKPCPFCGSATKVIRMFTGMYCVGCKPCGAIVSFMGKEEREEMIKAYNGRVK